MYEWHTLRTAAIVLLCLPLLHLALTVSRDLSDYLNPSPEVWADELQIIIESDREIVMPDLPILVVGGARVRLWDDLPRMLQPRETLLRALGDASLEDLAHYFDRLVAFYRPNILIVVPGYADLHLRDEKTPNEYVRALQEFLALDEAYAKTYWRYVIGPIEMPLHPEDEQRIESMVDVSMRLCADLERTTFIDPNPVLADINGRPDPDFFRGDGVNLSEAGYARLSFVLQQQLRDDGALNLGAVNGD